MFFIDKRDEMDRSIFYYVVENVPVCRTYTYDVLVINNNSQTKKKWHTQHSNTETKKQKITKTLSFYF